MTPLHASFVWMRERAGNSHDRAKILSPDPWRPLASLAGLGSANTWQQAYCSLVLDGFEPVAGLGL